LRESSRADAAAQRGPAAAAPRFRLYNDGRQRFAYGEFSHLNGDIA